VGHVQDEHQRDPLPEPAHQPSGGFPPDLPPLRRVGQPERLAARARLRPPLRLLRVRVQARRRRHALLEGRLQVRSVQWHEFEAFLCFFLCFDEHLQCGRKEKERQDGTRTPSGLQFIAKLICGQ